MMNGKQLNKISDQWDGLAKSDHEAVANFAKSAVPELLDEVARRIIALSRYGNHKAGCPVGELPDRTDCTCGFAKLFE